jgi:hypothetical protein
MSLRVRSPTTTPRPAPVIGAVVVATHHGAHVLAVVQQ